MMYAVRNDLRGARAISSKEELLPGEHIRDSLEGLDPVKSREEVEVDRLRAYADPLTGSDRYLIEHQVKTLAGDLDGAATAKESLIKRRAEIAAENPYPEE